LPPYGGSASGFARLIASLIPAQNRRHILAALVALPAEAMLRKALIRAAKTLLLPRSGIPSNSRNVMRHFS
jgi:hypothetical protein